MERRKFLKQLCASVTVACIAPTLIARDSITAYETETQGGIYSYVKKHGKELTYQELTEERLEQTIKELLMKPSPNDFTIIVSREGLEEFKKAMRCYQKPWQLFVE